MKKILVTLSLLAVTLMGVAQDFKMPLIVQEAPVEVNLPHDTFKAGNNTVELYYLAHSSVVLRFIGVEKSTWVYVDPVVRNGEKPVDYANLPTADLVLYTHAHPDHFDNESLEQHADKNSTIVCPSACKDLVTATGITQAVVTLENDKQMKFDIGLAIKAVPAYNTTKGREKFHPKGVGNGYLITLGKWTLYVAGDTEPIPEMADMAKKYDIQVALLPVNQPYTMTPDQFLSAVKTLKPKVVIPYHMGDTKMDQAIETLKQSKDVDVLYHEELR